MTQLDSLSPNTELLHVCRIGLGMNQWMNLHTAACSVEK